MRKTILMLGLGVALFTACQQEDDFAQQSQGGKMETIEFDASVGAPVTLKAGIAGADSYAWYVDGQLVSTAPEYVFAPQASGKSNIVLEVVNQGVVSKVLYSATTTYSLATQLAAYNLAANGTVYNASVPNYYWNRTYSDTLFTTDFFTFSHTGGDVSGYAYWDGFTVSNVHDDSNCGTTSSSDGWIANQWGCMDTSDNCNFMLGYWGYYGKDIPYGSFPIDKDNIPEPTRFSETGFSNWVKLGNVSDQYYEIHSITVTNSPWAYYGGACGDGFATAFNKTSDYLTLKVYPVYSDNSIGDSKDIQLAGYNTSFWGTTSWQTVNLYAEDAENWSDVVYLLFQMRSSDTGSYGMNTAAYFCLKDIQVQ